MRKLTSTRAEGALISLFIMAEGDSSSSFSETETDLKLSVLVYYSTETVTPHSMRPPCRCQCRTLTGFDHTRKVDYSSDSVYKLMVILAIMKRLCGNCCQLELDVSLKNWNVRSARLLPDDANVKIFVTMR